MRTLSDRADERRAERIAREEEKIRIDDTTKNRISFGRPVRQNIVRKAPTAKKSSILDSVLRWPKADQILFHKTLSHRLTARGKTRLLKSILGA